VSLIKQPRCPDCGSVAFKCEKIVLEYDGTSWSNGECYEENYFCDECDWEVEADDSGIIWINSEVKI
jgi:hypothetical protein